MRSRSIVSVVSCRNRRSYSTVGGTSSRRRVCVTGVGMVSPLGIGAEESFSRLVAGECGLKRLDTLFPFNVAASAKHNAHQHTEAAEHHHHQHHEHAKPMLNCVGGAVVDHGHLQDVHEKNQHLQKFYHVEEEEKAKMGRHDLFALIASEEALAHANWFPATSAERRRTGIVMASAFGNLTETIEAAISVKEGGIDALPKYTLAHIGVPSVHIGLKHVFEGPCFGLGAACAGGGYSISIAAALIESGLADVVVAGGCEAPLSPLGVGGFCRIGAHTVHLDPTTAVRPFDASRAGTALAEGAGAVVLESLDHAIARGATPLAEILGTSAYRDGRSITRPDAEGEKRTIMDAITRAGISPNDLDVIYAHATATKAGDVAEAEALKQIIPVPSEGPIIAASKGATGHGLAAAAAFDVIFAICSMKHGVVPPIHNIENVDPSAETLRLVGSKAVNKPIRRALVHGLGLGGEDAAIVLQKLM